MGTAWHSVVPLEFKFGLMLGLERVLVEARPKLASGKTELRRHQIDALAGMLTEPLHANQREIENGNGHAPSPRSRRRSRRPEEELGLLEREPDEETDEDVYVGLIRVRRAVSASASDSVGEDDRGSGLRRIRAHARREDQHAERARGFDEARCRDRLPRRCRMAEAETARRTRIRPDVDVLVGFLVGLALEQAELVLRLLLDRLRDLDDRCVPVAPPFSISR